MSHSFMGHQEVRRVLSRVYEQGNFPHTLLLHGKGSIGKFTLAKALGSTLLSGHQQLSNFPFLPADHPTQVMVDAGSHPDLVILSSSEKNLDVTSVRTMLDYTTLTPSKSERMVVIINNAELMNEQAINAILKALEEPKPSLYFILCTTISRALPATVLSRSWLLAMKALGKAEMLSLLPADINAERKNLILDIAEGSPGIAMGLLDIDNLPEWVRLIDDVFEKRMDAHYFTLDNIPEELARHVVSTLIHRKARRLFVETPCGSIGAKLEQSHRHIQDTHPPLALPLLPSLRQALSNFAT